MKKDKAGDVIESLAVQATEVLQSDAQMELEQAAKLGQQIAYRFARYEGGKAIYFPKGLEQQQRLRNIEIHRKFTGFNHADLATEYHLTEMRIRQILANPQN